MLGHSSSTDVIVKSWQSAAPSNSTLWSPLQYCILKAMYSVSFRMALPVYRAARNYTQQDYINEPMLLWDLNSVDVGYKHKREGQMKNLKVR